MTGPTRGRLAWVANMPGKPSNLVRNVTGEGYVAPAEPCRRCGVRADVGCKHRPAQGVVPLVVATAGDPPPLDRRSRPNGGQGLSFHLDELARNLGAAAEALKPLERDDD